MKLKNKRIIITGGTSGIGYEMVKYLQSDNKVIVIARDSKKLSALSREFKGVATFQADLSNIEELETLVATVTKQSINIDMLINNAAIQYTPALNDESFDYSSINHEVTVNFTSICSLTYLLLPALTHQNNSVILMVNSGLALTPKTSSAIYCATKGALNIFSQSLRYQLENSNISVQQVFLPLVETAMTTGRGNNKMSAKEVLRIIIQGVEDGILDHDIGKVKLLRFLLRLAPSIAKKIMKNY